MQARSESENEKGSEDANAADERTLALACIGDSKMDTSYAQSDFFSPTGESSGAHHAGRSVHATTSSPARSETTKVDMQCVIT